MLELLGYEVTDDFVDQLLAHFDNDQNGEVDIFEFRALWVYIKGDEALAAEKATLNAWEQLCARFDEDDDGKLTKSELTILIREAGFSITVD
eukprot:SAG31_NODE_22314_length_528_cov_1.188811_1_plen_91_part_10